MIIILYLFLRMIFWLIIGAIVAFFMLLGAMIWMIDQVIRLIRYEHRRKQVRAPPAVREKRQSFYSNRR